jgi:DNA polymerase-1
VLRLAPGRESTDLRNPVQVRELLAGVGVDVPNTRKWVLEPFRDTHPLVAALLEWRKAERIATTYGYAWLEAHVGADDRLRGTWTACDGAAGRMTAQNGLHNLPASLRPAVAAHPGHVFVRADLGQIEPRVLAAVSGDRAFAAATRADDLYAPVAATLGVERPVAKVAVLAAMYGQRSGAAGEALRGLERAYPTAMAFLDQAYAAGARGLPVRTFGGRTIPMGPSADGIAPGTDPARDAARGRFARNAVIQGAAAELFKAWAATVRATTRDLGAQIVLCLHDELLMHVPADRAEECLHRVVHALDDSARRWTGSTEVRFVADASIVTRWSDAKE